VSITRLLGLCSAPSPFDSTGSRAPQRFRLRPLRARARREDRPRPWPGPSRCCEIILGIAITNCQPASASRRRTFGRGCCQQRCDAAAMRAIKSVYAKTGRAFSARVPEEPLPRLTALHWDRGAWRCPQVEHACPNFDRMLPKALASRVYDVQAFALCRTIALRSPLRVGTTQSSPYFRQSCYGALVALMATVHTVPIPIRQFEWNKKKCPERD